jgi:NAD(P)-dependent dehydrogenase (short-subunit alcohol dehydrogenase family)
MSGKSIVITGGTSGIGKACALAFSAAGWQVAICGRRADRLAEMKDQAGLALAEAVDVADPEAVAGFFGKVAAEFGHLDVAFNNAGTDAGGVLAGDITIDNWHKVIDTNLNGAFYVAQQAFRAMREQSPQGGRIINNGSIASHAPRFGAAAYAASKHGLAGLTKAMSVEGRQFKIACGQIDLGNPLTEMIAGEVQARMQSDGTRKPEPTFDVKHVVDAVMFMANLPLEANVQHMTLVATSMPYLGRG